MKIEVFNERDIQKFITDKKHIVISIQDPNYDFISLPINSNRLDCIRLRFYDLDEETNDYPYDQLLFTEEHAKIILDTVEMWKDKINLICINCCAGISRSAGIAAALNHIYNGNDDYFFQTYIPNRLVYRTILKTYYEKENNAT